MELFLTKFRKNRPFSPSRGFTLVELLVVTPLVLLLIGSFIAVAVTLTGETLASRTQSSLLHSINDSLNRIRSEIRMSEGFLATNSFPVVSPQGSDEATEPFKNATTTSNALILSVLAMTDEPKSALAQPINLLNEPLTSCSHPDITTNKRLSVNIVYFVRDSTLWRRVVMPANYSSLGCGTPWRLPTCKPGYATSATQCKANDERLIEGVTPDNFIVEYFSSSSAQTPLATASNGAANDAARASELESSTNARITITAKQNAAGREIEESLSTRTNRSVGRPS